MKAIKKIIVYFLIVCLSTMAMCSCNSNDGKDSENVNPTMNESDSSSNDINSKSSESTYIYTGKAPITDQENATVSVLAVNSWYTTVDLTDSKILKKISENAGVAVEWNLIDPTTYYDAVSPMLAAGTDLSDIIFLPNLDSNQTYINSGMLIKLDEYFHIMPNFKAYLEGNPEIKASLTAQDGHIYYVPVVSIPDNYLPCLMYNEEWVAKLGIEEPKTLDDFVTMLRLFKENDMNGNNDTTDEIPMSVMAVFLPQMFGWAFGMDLHSGFYADDAGTVHYAYYEKEKYKNYLAFLNGLYSEGLLEMEYTYLTRDQITERFANNLTGVTFDYSWQMSQLYSTQFEEYTGDEGIVCGVEPLSGEYTGYYSGMNPVKGIFGVNKDSKDIELALKFLDYSMSEECQTMYVWGIEGESYTVKPDGTYAYTEKALSDSMWLQELGINPPCMPYHNSTKATDILLPDWHVAIDKKLANYSHAPWPFIYSTEEEAEEISFYLTDIQTYTAEMGVKFIIGTESLDHFNSYLSVLETMGIQKLLVIKQGQYDRYVSRK